MTWLQPEVSVTQADDGVGGRLEVSDRTQNQDTPGPRPKRETSAPEFFERNRKERPELIEGLLREGQLAAFAGAFGMGKSPVIVDLTLRFVHGLDWCGRRIARRPVIVIDCETSGPDYKNAMSAIAARFEVPVPRVRDELDVYLERDEMSERGTAALVAAVSQSGPEPKIDLITAALNRMPNAVIFVDPLEMFFRLDTVKKSEVLQLYRSLRSLLAKFQNAALFMTFNLRKRDKRIGKSDLLANPRDWLEEVCGSLDLLNRSDARLGIDVQRDEVRVINGIVRGREMHPLLIRPFLNSDDQPAGFEQVTPDQVETFASLTAKQTEHWGRLPTEFKFEDVADQIVPRSTLSRLIRAAIGFGALIKGNDGTFRKASTSG